MPRVWLMEKQHMCSNADSSRHRANSLRWCLFAAVLVIAGCASNQPYGINLMPAPDIYALGDIDPFEWLDPAVTPPYQGILYATDRAPSDNGLSFYQNKRGNVVRMGVGYLESGMEDFSWEEARKVSLAKNRPDNYPIRVKGVDEFGILDRSITAFTDSGLVGIDLEKPREQFIGLINEKLAMSKNKDIYIYIHGYKVGFENPLLVSAELWHFLGYDGVMIAYAWPSTPKTLAYVSDLESAAFSSHFLKEFIEVLAEASNAENIHLIAYSAGTRVAIGALYQMALLNDCHEKETVREKLRIGHVMLTGSDFGRQLFAAYMYNGLLNVSRQMTVYMSQTDQAMGVSRWLFNRERLGSMWQEGELDQRGIDFLNRFDNFNLINVTAAEGAATGNGHAYFRNSPWVSSDILMTLMYDLTPEQRGLVRSAKSPVWHFPEDYMERLTHSLETTNLIHPDQLSPDPVAPQ